MANEVSMALDELLRKVQVSDDVDFLREGVRALAEALMELEVTQHVGLATMSAPRSALASGMVPGSGAGTRG